MWSPTGGSSIQGAGGELAMTVVALASLTATGSGPQAPREQDSPSSESELPTTPSPACVPACGAPGPVSSLSLGGFDQPWGFSFLCLPFSLSAQVLLQNEVARLSKGGEGKDPGVGRELP